MSSFDLNADAEAIQRHDPLPGDNRFGLPVRPFNFLFYVLVDGVVGLPRGADPQQFTVIAPFSKKRGEWMNLRCLNIYDYEGRGYSLSLTQTQALDKIIPQTFATLLGRYRDHREAKSNGPDGQPSEASTRGVLKRAHVVAGQNRLIGKEAERRWEHGEDLSLAESKILEYHPSLRKSGNLRSLRRLVRQVGLRKSMRQSGLSQHTIEKILTGQPVRQKTLARLVGTVKSDE
jgi:hypothetical protein